MLRRTHDRLDGHFAAIGRGRAIHDPHSANADRLAECVRPEVARHIDRRAGGGKCLHQFVTPPATYTTRALMTDVENTITSSVMGSSPHELTADSADHRDPWY